MSKQTVTKDVEHKQIIIERTFDVSKQRLWQAWSDQKMLESWWGPRDWPTTTSSFDFREGGHWHYYMTGPDGTQAWGLVDFLDIDAPSLISADDSFSNKSGDRTTDLPNSHWLIELSGEQPSTLRTTLTFNNETDMQKIIDMGFEAGYTESLDKLEEHLTISLD